MRKFIITFTLIGLLAGCSASSSVSSAAQHKVSAVVHVDKPAAKDASHWTDSFKLQRNYTRMTRLVKYLGTRENRTPYVFSGSTTRGWDCSGMVVWLYKQFGITLPHSADKQSREGRRVSLSDVQVGDIAVYAYKGRHDFYHSSIVYKIKEDKNGKRTIWIINANRATGTTTIQPLSDYKNSQVRFVRIIEQKDMTSPLPNPLS